MKHAAWFLLATATVVSAQTAPIQCKRAANSFALSADPESPPWKQAPVQYAAIDKFGKPSPSRFEFRTLWTSTDLHFLFICPYEELNLKPNPATDKETYELWNWDVTEIFIGSDTDPEHRYREYQVSPQGEWVDLDIDRKSMDGKKAWLWNSGFAVKARIDAERKSWYGEMRIPISSIDSRPPEPGREFRINLYRLTGKVPHRLSTMWTPTMNSSHHTPEKFGRMVLGR
ncbi:MAG: carbohydrate-binding family 9-like protein [Acidobacteriia bacterium]|nr:carbohydrate-binding family 9-like protein [Terriglobia bacterium]